MKNVIVCTTCVKEWIDCQHPTFCATEITTLDYQLQKARREIAENRLLQDLKVKADYGDYGALITSIFLENGLRDNQLPQTY